MKIDQTILDILVRAEVKDDLLVLTGQLDRKTYEKVNKVLELAGAKWDRKRKGHVFQEGTTDRLDEILLTGEAKRPAKDLLDFFPTPESLAKDMLAQVDITSGLKMLEPSAGHGAIAKVFWHAGFEVHANEIDPDNLRVLSSVAETPARLTGEDFLTMDASPTFDVVAMNPPFSKGRDVRHVMHAFNFLRRGGKLVAIMSAGVTFRQDRLYREFRELLAANQGEVSHIAQGAFKESGTMVNTVMVTMTKGED